MEIWIKTDKTYENEINNPNEIMPLSKILKLNLFYKFDEKTNQMTISKTKIITIILSLVSFFAFLRNSIYSGMIFNPISLIILIIMTLIIASVTYVFGLFFRFIVNKIS